MKGPDLLKIVTKYDSAVDKKEAATAKLINKRLIEALNNINGDLTSYYERQQQQGSLAAQMQVRRSQELTAILSRIEPEYETYFQGQLDELLRTSNAAGTELAGELLSSYGAQSAVGSFTEIPYAALANQVSEGVKRLGNHTANFRSQASAVIEQGLIQGKGATWMKRQLKEQVAGITSKKAEDIARTESSSALNAAAEQRYAAAEIKYVQLMITPSQRVCPFCAGRNGAVFELGKMRVPLHVRCLVPGTVVSAPGAHSGTERQYEGPVVTIETARGEKLAVTPNHPILTNEGWVAAGSVNESHCVFSSVDGERITRAIAPNKYNTPTVVEEILASLRMSSGMFTTSVEGSAEHFHGDGIPDSKVSIVNSNSFLLDKLNTHFSQEFCHRCLMDTPRETSSLLPFSHSALNFEGDFNASSSVMGGFNLAGSLSLGHSAPFNFLGFTSPSYLASRSFNDRKNRASSDSVIIREFFDAVSRRVPDSDSLPNKRILGSESFVSLGFDEGFMLRNASLHTPSSDFVAEKLGANPGSTGSVLNRLAGKVHTDRVVNTNVVHYSGPVYNLETDTGWYFANNIITHNCRCMILPYDKAWQKAGLTDDAFIVDYHKKGVAELRKNGFEPKYTEQAPFEKSNKLPAPKAVWSPRGKSAETVAPKPTKSTAQPTKKKSSKKKAKATVFGTSGHGFPELEKINGYTENYNQRQALIREFYRQKAGVTKEEAIERLDSIRDYTGNDYTEIRAFQRGANPKWAKPGDKEKFLRKAQKIEAYIETAVKYDGTIYRGIGLDSLEDFYKRFGAVGDEFTETTMNSWSSEKEVADSFADDSQRQNEFVFTVKKQTRGASIEFISQIDDEKEVLVPSNSKYKVVSIDADTKAKIREGHSRYNVVLEEINE